MRLCCGKNETIRRMECKECEKKKFWGQRRDIVEAGTLTTVAAVAAASTTQTIIGLMSCDRFN